MLKRQAVGYVPSYHLKRRLATANDSRKDYNDRWYRQEQSANLNKRYAACALVCVAVSMNDTVEALDGRREEYCALERHDQHVDDGVEDAEALDVPDNGDV